MPVVTTTSDRYDDVELPTRIDVQQGATLKAGDTRPSLIATLEDANGDAIPLAGVREVTFVMASEGRREAVAVGAADILDVGTGTVRYAWTRGDTSKPQTYQIEFEVTYNDDTTITVPTEGAGTVTIENRIAQRTRRPRDGGADSGGGGGRNR